MPSSTARAGDSPWDGPVTALGQHPRNAGFRWTDDLQGVTTDKTRTWYFAQTRRIWKIPMHLDLNRSFDRRMSKGLSGVERAMGFEHMGDPDYYDGQLYVPMERRSSGQPSGVSLRDADLNFLCVVTLSQGVAAPWIAVNPADHKLYSSECNATELFRYRRAVNGGLLSLGPVERVRLLDEKGAPLTVLQVQGGAFANDGRLYLVTKVGIEGFDVTTGRRHMHVKIPRHPRIVLGQNLGDELEGIEYVDFDNGGISAPGVAGQLHVVMIDNDAIGGADDLYFEHFRVATAPRIAGP
jgi:hypothetical protein